MRLALSLAWAGITLLNLAVPGCVQPGAQAPERRTLRSSSSSSAVLLAKSLSTSPDLSVSVVNVSGSLATIDAIRSGSIDVGVASADLSYLAFTGQLSEFAEPFSQLRAIAVSSLISTFRLLVSKRTHVRSVEDLRGMRVSVGPGYRASPLLAELVLNASGLSLTDIRNKNVPYEQAAQSLNEDQLDAWFVFSSVEDPEVAKSIEAGARLVDIDGPEIEQLRVQYPFLVMTSIPRGTYSNQSSPIQTIGVNNLLLCRADLKDDLAYRIAEVFSGVLRGSFMTVDLDRVSATSIPLHPGAARYHRGRELSQ